MTKAYFTEYKHEDTGNILIVPEAAHKTESEARDGDLPAFILVLAGLVPTGNIVEVDVEDEHEGGGRGALKNLSGSLGPLTVAVIGGPAFDEAFAKEEEAKAA
jgi:hypothetical protein